MFEQLPKPKGDPILALIAEYQRDTRSDKIDLGIGVYRNDAGITPIMQAVRKAEISLAEHETTKAYQGPQGDQAFNQAMLKLTLEGCSAITRANAIQTPGATGALRILANLIYQQNPKATVWLSRPSYVNHRPIMEEAGLAVQEYRYFDADTKQVDEAAMLADIEKLDSNDVLLMHGSCHNPTGADISFTAWQKIAELTQKNGFLPFIDVAYQGLGDSLEKDAQGFRLLADTVDEVLIATSCSKNFGLYRERTGAAIIVAKTQDIASTCCAKLGEVARGFYSMPPAHGAAIVRSILTDSQLQTEWLAELNAMTQRVQGLRSGLVKAFQNTTQSQRFDYLLEHKGMFSLTGLDNAIISRLKAEYGIYIVAGGRINVAGLKQEETERLVQAFVSVGA